MSVNFKVVQRGNPMDQNAPKMYYALAVRKEKVDLDDLIRLVSMVSTMSEGDVKGVVATLVNVCVEHLRSGNSVELDKLGSLSVVVNSEGRETSEEVTSGAIKNARLRYRPSKSLKNVLKTLDFQKIGESEASTDPSGSGGGTASAA